MNHFNSELAATVNIDINVTVLSGEPGSFSVAVHSGVCEIVAEHVPKSDITVGFLDAETMIDMFTKGASPMSLVMSGKMTINGNLQKGKEIKGLFVKNN